MRKNKSAVDIALGLRVKTIKDGGGKQRVLDLSVRFGLVRAKLCRLQKCRPPQYLSCFSFCHSVAP